MPRARNIKPGFFDNEGLAAMEYGARLLFIGLWTLADREGRLEDRPKKIRATIFPYERDIDIDGWLNTLETSEEHFIIRYEVEGAAYIQIRNFHKHQNPHHMETPSEIPAPVGFENRFNHKPISKVQRERIMKRDGRKCVTCSSTTQLSIDHIVPVSGGGSSEDENLRLLCGPCNSRKGAKSISISERVDDDLITARDWLDVESSIVPNETLIPDSLIPDVLIPDSGVPALPPPTPPTPTPKVIPFDAKSDPSDGFDLMYRAHPIPGHKREARAFYQQIIASAVNPEIVHRAIVKSHAEYVEYWAGPGIGEWKPTFAQFFEDEWYLRKPREPTKRGMKNPPLHDPSNTQYIPADD